MLSPPLETEKKLSPHLEKFLNTPLYSVNERKSSFTAVRKLDYNLIFPPGIYLVQLNDH